MTCGWRKCRKEFTPKQDKKQKYRSTTHKSADSRFRNGRLNTRQEAKIRARDVRLSSGCIDCRTLDRRVLTFDHVRSVKIFNISRGVKDPGISLSKFMTELQKCDLVCSNCHLIRAWERSRSLEQVI